MNRFRFLVLVILLLALCLPAFAAGKPLKPTGNETVKVEPNVVHHMDQIFFYGEGFHPHVAYEIRYLGFVWNKAADETGAWWFGISASAIPEEEWGTITATVNLWGERHPKTITSCTFVVVE